MAPLHNKSATAVSHALVSHLLCPYTTPSLLLRDNGPEFRNDVLKSICHQYGITQSFITTYHPVSNGLVERVNRKILEILRHIAGAFHEAWQDWLPHVAACMNGSVNASTGKLPHYVVYGSEKRLPYDLLLMPHVPVYSVDNYSQNHLRALQIINDSVRRSLQASRTEMIQKQHATAHPVTFKVNDIFKSAPERQSKLNHKFSGPFIITERLHGNKFKIYNSDTQTSEVVHSDRLKGSDILAPTSIPLPASSSTSAPTAPCPYTLRPRAGS